MVALYDMVDIARAYVDAWRYQPSIAMYTGTGEGGGGGGHLSKLHGAPLPLSLPLPSSGGSTVDR